MKSQLLLLGATLSAACFVAAPVGAQPVPVEQPIPKVDNLSLEKVALDVAEKLAMPARPIRLRLNDVTLKAALQELETQSGIDLQLGYSEKSVLEKKLSLDMETPFFRPAFDAIMDEAGVKASVRYELYSDGLSVQFGRNSTDDEQGPQAGAGPFQVRLSSVESNFRETIKPNVNGLATRSQDRTFSLSIDSKPDPIMNVTGTPLVIIKRIEDDKGRSLLDENTNDWLRYDFDRNWYGARSKFFKKPDENVKSLARVEGTTIYAIPTERKSWEIADITNNKNAVREFESSGRTITARVKSATIENSIVTVEFEITAPTPNENEDAQSSPLFIFGQIRKSLRLEDQNGTVFRLGGSNSSYSGSKLTLNGQFAAEQKKRAADGNGERAPVQIAEPIKLVFDGSTEWVQTEVPFSFSDVPLP